MTTNRSERYGKLIRGWDWRTTKERLEKAEQLRQQLGVGKTELLEMALDLLLNQSPVDEARGLP